MGLERPILWTAAKAGRMVGRFKGYLKNTSNAKKIFDGFNVYSIGSDLLNAVTGTESTSSEASPEFKKVSLEEMGQILDKEKEKNVPMITVDPDQRELQPKEGVTITDSYKKFPNPVINKEVNTVNKLLHKLLDQSLLADDDNDQETAYFYDLYFINTMKETALKRWPTIRNYQNAYSFAGMLKEIKEESTYEEMVLILFYFRMV